MYCHRMATAVLRDHALNIPLHRPCCLGRGKHVSTVQIIDYSLGITASVLVTVLALVYSRRALLKIQVGGPSIIATNRHLCLRHVGFNLASAGRDSRLLRRHATEQSRHPRTMQAQAQAEADGAAAPVTGGGFEASGDSNVMEKGFLPSNHQDSAAAVHDEMPVWVAPAGSTQEIRSHPIAGV